MEIILRWVSGYGWLATIEQGGNEIYRGEFAEVPHEALDKAIARLEEENG